MTIVLFLIQFAATAVMGVYFFNQLRVQKRAQPQTRRDGGREMENLRKMRAVRLSEPLSENVRPKTFSDIVGQEDGILSLKAILCGENPQHVLIYGPPGVGKTCAARLTLEAAKLSANTPFKQNAPFIEMDATCVRFDERAIADPLIGSVHDPIYQGAGQLGVLGVPQPKPGAVSRAHGGVLFLDEIGELHPIQMNKLLKVLEDRRVMFESSYYDPEDNGVPRYIHDIFKNGMPADFRLVGATTRSPEDIAPALRSRCMEIFFRPLTPPEISRIAFEAAARAGSPMEENDAFLIGRYAASGRDAVNMVQMAAGVAALEGRKRILRADVEWVIESGHYARQPDLLASTLSAVGQVHGLAVHGSHQGAVMEIEAAAGKGTGRVRVTGIVEEEQLGGGAHVMKRPSTARASLDNVQTVLTRRGYLDDRTDVHVNFPGGAPVDGPSAGIAMALAAISALQKRAADGETALTGELSVTGRVLPVGGVPVKVLAAKNAGLKRVLIPKDNDMERLHSLGVEVVPIGDLSEAVALALREEPLLLSVPVPALSAALAAPKG